MDLGKFEAPLFDRSAPEYRRKLWVRLETPDGSVHLVLLWRRILLTLALLGGVAWFTGAAAVYAFVRVRHDFAGASYLNLVWPARWPLHRAALGRHYLTRGQAALAAGEFVDAARFFAAGVARVPDDPVARRQLAVLYIRFGHVPAGLEVLAAGLPGARDDLDYLKLTFGLLDEVQDDARILELVQLYLPGRPDDILPHQFLALQAATAHFHRGRYDAAEQLVSAWGLGRSLEGQLLLARCDWERGYPELALLRLEQEQTRFAGRDALLLQLIRFYRELGHPDQTLNTALLRYTADPVSPGPQIDLLYARHDKGDRVRLAREIEDYVANYAADPQAMLLLAWFAADTGDVALARRLQGVAAVRGHPLAAYELVLVQTLVEQGDYRAALAAAEAALQGPTGTDPRFAATLAGLRALACFGAGDAAAGGGYLQAFLAREHPRATDALLLARRLEALGARPAALQVLTAAVQVDALNQATLTELVRLHAAAGHAAELEELVPRLLGMRKPSRAVLQEVYLRLDAATPARRALRQAIDTALEKSPSLPEP